MTALTLTLGVNRPFGLLLRLAQIHQYSPINIAAKISLLCPTLYNQFQSGRAASLFLDEADTGNTVSASKYSELYIFMVQYMYSNHNVTPFWWFRGSPPRIPHFEPNRTIGNTYSKFCIKNQCLILKIFWILIVVRLISVFFVKPGLCVQLKKPRITVDCRFVSISV